MKYAGYIVTVKELIKKYVMVLFIIAVAGVCWGEIEPEIPEGEGTAESPYKIDSLGNLYWITQNDSKWSDSYVYLQTDNIDASDTQTWSNGGWTPIGNSTMKFKGTYDGGGHIIGGLYINRPDEEDIGFFGRTEGAIIKNLGLENVDITGGKWVGALVGVTEENTLIQDCYSSGLIDGNGNNNVGGLIGLIYKSVAKNNYSVCNVDGKDNVGGFVGRNLLSEIIDCYFAGEVSGTTNVGGFCGSADKRTGFCDTNNYWNIELSGVDTSVMGTGKTTTQMTYPYDEDIYTDWDFENVWRADITGNVNNGYPYLYYQVEDEGYIGEIVPPEEPNEPYNGNVGGFEIVFIPSVDEEEFIAITVFISKDSEIEAINGFFSNPQNMGAYYRFNVDGGTVFRRGSELRLAFENEPNQLWFRNGNGDWYLIQKGDDWFWEDGKAIITQIDTSSLRSEEIFEYTGDNGIAGETLPVELSSFTASLTSDMTVQLKWIAETEANLIGYNIYRCRISLLSEAERINRVLIPAHNTSTAMHYEYFDRDIVCENSYYYWLQSNESDLSYYFFGPVLVTVEKMEEKESGVEYPIYNTLRGASPNPFNPGTSIVFSLSEQTKVTIKIYNAKGQYVRSLVEGVDYKRGRDHGIYWDGRDYRGDEVGSGVYHYIMDTESGFREAKRMILMK